MASSLLFDGYEFDPDTGRLARDGEEVQVPPRAIHALEALLESPGELVPREELERVVSGGSAVTRRSVPEAILQLRRAFDDDASNPRFIETVPRRGYRFVARVRPADARDTIESAFDGRAWKSWAAGLEPLPVATAMVILLGVGILAGMSLSARGDLAAPSVPLRTDLAIGERRVPPSPEGSTIALSPDGRLVAYAGLESNGMPSLRVEDLSAGESALAVTGHGRIRSPFFSPDGDRVGFFAEGHLQVVGSRGGTPRPLCPVGRRLRVSATWSRELGIVVSQGTGTGLAICSMEDGRLEPLTTLGNREVQHAWPHALPRGGLIFGIISEDAATSAEASLAYLGARDRGVRVLMENFGATAVHARDRLFFLRGKTLHTAPFDPATGSLGTIAGTSVAVAVGAAGNGHLAVNDQGTLLFARRHGDTGLYWIDPQGTGQPLQGTDLSAVNFRLSDTGLLALVTGGQIRVWDRRERIFRRVPGQRGVGLEPVWSRRNDGLYFASSANGTYGIYRAGWSRQPEALVIGPDDVFPSDVTADESHLLFTRIDPDTGRDIWWVDPRYEDALPTPLIATTADESDARVSPDGKWLAYVSDHSGCERVYITSLSDTARRWVMSPTCARQPRWAPDGRALYHLRHDGSIVSTRWSDSPEEAPGVTSRTLVDEASYFEVTPTSILVRRAPGGPTGDRLFLAQEAGTWLETLPRPSGERGS